MANDLEDLLSPVPSARAAPPAAPGTYKRDQPPRSDLDDLLRPDRPAPDAPEALRAKLEADRRKFGDWARYAGQELLLGAGDEAFAGLASTFGPNTYTDELSDWRKRAKRYQREEPVGSIGTGVAAALPSALPLGLLRLPQGANLVGRMAAQAGLGAGFGGVHGFASGEGNAGNRGDQALHEGIWSGGLSAGLPLAASAARGVQRFTAPMFGGEGRMATLLEQAGLGPSGRKGVVDRLMVDEFRPLPTSRPAVDPLPGTDFTPSPAQLLADPKLRALEAQLMGPEAMLAQRTRQGDVVQRAAEPLLPGPRLTHAEMDLESARALVQPSLLGDTPGLSSTRLHTFLTDLRDRSRATIANAFDKLDMPNIDLPTEPLKKNFRSMIDSFSALAGEKDVLPKKLIDEIEALGPNVTMEELQRLRSRLLSDARLEDKGSFEKRIFNRAAGEVLDAMEVGINQMGPGSEIIKRQYAKARDLHRNMKETFDNERVGHLFDSDATPSTVAQELLTGKGSRERVDALLKMSDGSPKIERTIRDWLGHDLNAAVAGKEGDAAARAMDRWFAKHTELFNQRPDLAEGFLKVADAHRLATDLGRRQALVERIQAGDDPEKLIKKFGPDLDRLFPDASERQLVDALREAGRMLNLRGAAGVESKGVSKLQSDHSFMDPLTGGSYGLIGKLTTLGPLGRFAYKGPQEDVLNELKRRVTSGSPELFTGLKAPTKLGPRLLPPTPAVTPYYEWARGRSREDR